MSNDRDRVAMEPYYAMARFFVQSKDFEQFDDLILASLAFGVTRDDLERFEEIARPVKDNLKQYPDLLKKISR